LNNAVINNIQVVMTCSRQTQIVTKTVWCKKSQCREASKATFRTFSPNEWNFRTIPNFSTISGHF